MAQSIARTYDAIRQGILDGRHRPGDRLLERDIAAELGISRTPVREALRLLAADGLVAHRPNAGVSVTELSEKAMADLGDLRAHLASMAGRLAARGLPAADRAWLGEQAQRIGHCLRDAGQPGFDVPGAFALLRDFHLRLLGACGNEWLARAFRQTTFQPVMHATYMEATAGEWAGIARYFPALLEALDLGDEALCSALMEAYFRGARHRLVRAYRARTGSQGVVGRG